MSTPSLPELPQRVFAEAVVRSASGASLLDMTTPVTCETVDRFLATADTVQAAAQELRRAGFEIVDIGSLSITVAASPDVYERTLSTQLQAVDRPVIKELGENTTATFINAVDTKPFGEIDVTDTRFSTLLDGFALNEPVYYFLNAVPSSFFFNAPSTCLPTASAQPPITSEAYLSVPDGIVEGLNAAMAHQRGITGKAVKVAMVDSGWYAHPYFAQHHYNVKVVLAPGSADSTTDGIGHGTGESANLLAIAPDIELTMVKADVAISGVSKNVNAVSALRTAIELRPDIISCSWGSDQRRRIVSPYNRVMAAVIADAVRRGITVIFSAGNGQYGFPAQHPDVIAAGGVYRYLSGPLQGTLEASNYASSFASPLYPKRQVPDVCGLVGKLPYGSYLMLPIPPGSVIDRRLSALSDGTKATDGWAAFSGTSAAAPQVAGVCALLKQLNPNLTPVQVKDILQITATDVSGGYSNPSSSGAAARDGPDLATGYGLVDAGKAIDLLQSAPQYTLRNNRQRGDSILKSAKKPTITKHQSIKSFNQTSRFKGASKMQLDHEKIYKQMDDILWEFEKILKAQGLEDTELIISPSNFTSRSLKSKTAYSLRQILDECLPLGDDKKITTKHIAAAQGLINLNRYVETAISVLSHVIQNSPNPSLQRLSIKALGEAITFDESSESTNFLNCEPCGATIPGKRWCTGSNRYENC